MLVPFPCFDHSVPNASCLNASPSVPAVPAGPCHVAPAPKEPVCSPTSVLGMAGEASSVEEESTLLASVSSQGLLAAQHSPLDQD